MNATLRGGHGWVPLTAILLLPVLILLAAGTVHAAYAPSTEIKIGVLAKRGYAYARQRWNPTAEYLSQTLPAYRFEIIPLDFEEVRMAVMSRQIDFLITNSGYYVELEFNHRLKRLATMINLLGTEEQRVFGGVIFTRSDRRDIDSLEDIVGKSFWAVDRLSLGGWLAAWGEFYRRDIRPVRDFSLLKFAGTHDAVVAGVLNGEADAGTVRTDTLERMAEEGWIDLHRIKVLNRQSGDKTFPYLLSTRLYPEWPFAALPHVPDLLAAQVAESLLRLSATSDAARSAKIGGWVRPLDYQPIHDLLREYYLCLHEQHIGQLGMWEILRRNRSLSVALSSVLLLLTFAVLYTLWMNRKLEIRVTEKSKALEKEAAERRDAEEKLNRAEKMEAIGQMASGVAHDLNNILSGLVSYPDLLLMRVPRDSELVKPLTVIKDSGMRAAEVVADLLTVSRDAAKVSSMTDINVLVLEYLQSPEGEKLKSVYAGISLVTHLEQPLKPVCCSPTHVKKCIMNLFLNAAEAIRDHGEIVATTESVRLPAGRARELGLEAGEYVTLAVADNGSGIDAEDMKHIFEPFYSKKELGRSGTGIGLTVVWNAMQDHGGTVTVQSADRGSVFTLYFPVPEAGCKSSLNSATADSREEKSAFRDHGERILIVDDEAAQRSILRDILSAYGYRVHAVASGGDAVDYVRKHRVELVILDMILGHGPDGLETYRQIVQLQPQQKALVASGFSQSEKVEEVISLGVGGFIRKPYSVEKIIRMVRDELEK